MPEMKTLTYYQNLKYPIEILEDENAYVASIPDLPGCVAYGETMQDAVDALRSVKKLWLEGRLEANLPIAEPSELDEYSGKFVLRISRGLHKSLQREAQRQGVSLNQYIGQTLAERHKLFEIEHVVRDAVKRCFVSFKAVQVSRPASSPTMANDSCKLAWLGRHEHQQIRILTTRGTVSGSSEDFGSVFVALVGHHQPKSYELTYERPDSWTTNVTKKAKAHANQG